jgi:hypothetical protein
MNRYCGLRPALRVRDLRLIENYAPVPCPADLSLKTQRNPVGHFAPPAITGLVATMDLSDSPDAIWAALSFRDLAAHTLLRASWVPEFLAYPYDTSPRS